MLKKYLTGLFQAVAAARKQVSKGQLIVTAVSAAVMLGVLIAFWNLFILPHHSTAPDSKAFISSLEKGGQQSQEASPPGGGRKIGENSTSSEKGPSTASSGAASASATLPKPDMSLAVSPIEGDIVKSYGFVFSPTFNDYRFHGGIDISGSEGEAVKCVLDGVVESVNTSKEEGSTITIDHGGNWKTVYSHLGTVQVEEGFAAGKGHVLGYLGTPGLSESAEGCHLHFEILHNGKRVNPLEYFDYQ